MYLKALEIQGFKSFAKKGEFRFESSVTAIVGPNGSGKSNVAEAFRFALGEQSIKTMRGKKGEDLIWNGSPQVAKMNRAGVKITFDNTNRFLSHDFDEVIVERVVHRDGINQYLINGTQVRLKDVVELLAGANIGQSGHHIISQGEADRILSAHPRERKIMIEEALGLKIYHYKKDESLKKLEKTEENMVQVEGLRKEIAPHLKFLKKQVEKIEKAESMRDDLLLLYKEYLQREHSYISITRSLLTEDMHAPQEELRHIEKQLQEAKDAMMKSVSADAKSEELIYLEESLSRLRSEKSSLTREVGKLEGQLELVRRLVEKRKHTGDAPVPYGVVKEVVDVADAGLRDVLALQSLDDVRDRIEAIRSTLRTLLGSVQSESDESEKEIEELLEKLEEFKRSLEKLLSEERDLERSYHALKQQLESDKDESRAAERAVFELMAKKSEVALRLSELESKGEFLQHTEAEFKRELGEAAVLVGRGVLSYKEESIRVDGHVVSESDMAVEPREKQEERRRALERMKIRLEEFGAGASDEIMREFKDVSDRDVFLERELADLHVSADSLKQIITDLEERLTREFGDGLAKINKEFGEFFTLMFGGGSAQLNMIAEKKRSKAKGSDLNGMDLDGDVEEGMQEDEETEEGIEISVNLPRKRIKSLLMLSGGERALTSIALIFAMSQVNPPPFVILDETDAALDEANSRRYGDMLENLAKKSQLIVITHNRETMSRAGILYGVTMGSDGVSKLLSVKFEEAVAVAK